MSTPKTTARTLLRANRKLGVSWRTISKQGYRLDDVIILPGLNHATLNKFAMRRGAWIPADINKQKLLGIYHEKQQRPKMIAEMSNDELLAALNNRQPMIANFSQRTMKEFVSACKASSKARKVNP